MEIKGSAVKSIPDFIKKTHPEKYLAWMEALPETSKILFKDGIMPSNWYPMKEAAEVPTEVLGKLLYNNAAQGAWQCGRFSAENSLTGIYKFFIKAASPFFIVDKAGKIFTTFYQPSAMEVVKKGTDYVVLHITRFDEPSELIEHRVAGWIERAMEIHGFGYVLVEITKSLAHGDELTEFHVSWR
jgi:hypothetical protein